MVIEKLPRPGFAGVLREGFPFHNCPHILLAGNVVKPSRRINAVRRIIRALTAPVGVEEV